MRLTLPILPFLPAPAPPWPGLAPLAERLPPEPGLVPREELQLQTQPALRLIAPLDLFGGQQAPDFRTAGQLISQVGESFGYARGTPIRDPQVLQAMFAKAGELYGIPGDYLYRVARRESSASHWDDQGRIRSQAAVGIMQIEKSAYPEWVQGGARAARENAYDLGNNIAMGALVTRKALDRLASASGQPGPRAWEKLGPLLDIAYNAGSGALRLAQRIARSQGLDPFNWQHLLFGREVAIPARGVLQVPGDWIRSSPVHQATSQIHQKRVQEGNPRSYPIYWDSPKAVRRFDFDGDGVATKAERLISRIVYTMTGRHLRARD